MAELKAMRGEMKDNTEKINEKMTSMGIELTAVQTSMIVVQSRLGAIEKEQNESELLLMSNALKWVGEMEIGGVVERKKRNAQVIGDGEEVQQRGELEPVDAGDAILGGLDRSVLGVLDRDLCDEAPRRQRRVEEDEIVMEAPEEPAGRRIRRPNGKSNEQLEAEAAEKKKRGLRTRQPT